MMKRSDRLPFCRPSIGDEEIAAVTEVLRSGWITSGAKTREFERMFAQFTGASHAISVSSATGGLQILLDALDIGPGDEVIMPTLTFACDPNMVELCGARPIFCDIDPHTLLCTPQTVADKLSSRTRAVLVVHYAGAPVDLDGIADVLRGSGAIVIEDCAHALGTYYKGEHVGLRNPSFFSFHPIKNITTGEGGMITTSDPELYRSLCALRFHGIDKDAWQRYGDRATPGYDMQAPGYKYNLTDVASSIGLVQLSKLPRFNERRAQIAMSYRLAFAGNPNLAMQTDPEYPFVHSNHLSVVMTPNRDKFVERLSSNFNIETGLHFPLCHRLKYYAETYGVPHLPSADFVGDRLISLPLFPAMSDDDVQYVIRAVQKACE